MKALERDFIMILKSERGIDKEGITLIVKIKRLRSERSISKERYKRLFESFRERFHNGFKIRKWY